MYGAPPPGYAPGYPPPAAMYAAPPPQETIGDGMKILLYILSFLIPLAGFIIGLIYYTKVEPELKNVGKTCIVLALLAIVIGCVCYFLFVAAFIF